MAPPSKATLTGVFLFEPEQECVKRKAGLEERVERLKAEVREMDSAGKQVSRDVEVLGVEEVGVVQRSKDLEQQARQQVMDPAQLDKLEKQVRAFEREHSKAAEAGAKVQREVDR